MQRHRADGVRTCRRRHPQAYPITLIRGKGGASCRRRGKPAGDGKCPAEQPAARDGRGGPGKYLDAMIVHSSPFRASRASAHPEPKQARGFLAVTTVVVR
jgi:hypothetical protein